ncbi:GTPase ObgE [Paenibacillus darwinianus]|uniref:GTPase Obg n=1 Tax=Paenibacillus darwinianus TaxID=1380763 RepID=A0A9W5RZU0_9BACL|nr:GTPase ObgE [Paenibacillus darwinianus]EXX85551.1 GTPase ObgE [Paenibacillus darwinianus]EXX85596.1 GTPase ObgE [Paenibacillus darwinianus]EXX85673.1 GTPase ObgE [Paenibacillus darwinianus]
MFVDKAKIFVKGGDGGDGLISFRRELYVPEGGPAGGDGGRGANVIFRVDEGLRTLVDFRYQKHFKAPRGEKGKVKGMHGAGAEDMIVRIPPGTVIINDDTQEVIADMTRHGQEVVVAKGGRGGRGNIRFATANNPAPYIAENGEEGEERWVVLELKVMADVGLVGFPSVGKSTLLSVVSAAKPKIGAYHFTTITPNLGVVDVGDGRSFVMADLPGLIEGAAEGVGLGHEFLRHVERTRVIIHVVDMAGTEGRDPFEDWMKINDELVKYNAKLAERPQIIAANKMDMPDAGDQLELFKQQLEELADGKEYEIVPISSLTKNGIQELLYKAADLLDALPEAPPLEEVSEIEERKVYRYEKKDNDEFTIRKEEGVYIVESASIERFIKRTNLTSYDAVMRFARIMRNLGVDKALRKEGAKDGDLVQIGDYSFEFFEGADYYFE